MENAEKSLMNDASPVMRLTKEHIAAETRRKYDPSTERLIVNGLRKILKSGGDKAESLLRSVDWKTLMCKSEHIADTLSRSWGSVNRREPSQIDVNAAIELPGNDGSVSIIVMKREHLEDGSVTVAIVA